MFCVKCGKPVAVGANFCAVCGAKIEKHSTAPQNIPPSTAIDLSESIPVQGNVTVMDVRSGRMSSRPPESLPEASVPRVDTSRRSRMVWPWVAGSAVVLSLVLAVVLMHGGKSKAASAEVSPTPAPGEVPILTNPTMSILAGSFGQRGAIDAQGSEARFYSPKGMATDGHYLYVCDTGNHAIRRISLQGGQVTTLAGEMGVKGFKDGPTHEARFASPSNLVLVGDSLMVTDSANHAIRQIDVNTGVTKTIVGTSGKAGKTGGNFESASFYWPDGIASWGDGLLVVDGNNHVIRFIDLSTRTVSVFAGQPGCSGRADGIMGQFQNPVGLTIVGDIAYVADFKNASVRALDLKTRDIRTLPIPGLLGPANTVVDGRYILISDYLANTIVCVNLDNFKSQNLAPQAPSSLGALTHLNKPMGMVRVGRTLYVSDLNDNVIWKMDLKEQDALAKKVEIPPVTETPVSSKPLGTSAQPSEIKKPVQNGNQEARPIVITGLRLDGDQDFPHLLGTAKNTSSRIVDYFFYRVRFLNSSREVVWTFSGTGGPINPGESWVIHEGLMPSCVGTHLELIEVSSR